MGFLEENHRNPSKHRIEEHDMLNWLKANRKALYFKLYLADLWDMGKGVPRI